jgi:hypothetical protein
MYEKRIAELKASHQEELRKQKEDWEKRLKELGDRHEADMKSMRA